MSDIEEPLIQQRPTGLSKERRRSIVLSIFDAAFTILLWLISTVSKGDDWRKSFLQEIDITNPNFFKISLFDIVIMGLIRATILIICYAAFPFKHWLPVAVTTGLTSAFIIIKVLFFFSRTQSQLPQYILVLASFAMCWFELYVMPFKYSQRERQYSDYSRQDDEESRNVRTPSVQSARRVFRIRERLQGRHAEETTDIEEYRSAIDFSSDDESPHHRKIPRLSEETKLQIAEKLSGAEIHVEQLLREAKLGEWKLISGNSDPIVLAGPENYYCIRTEFKMDPMLLFNAAWKDILKWNTQLLVGQTVAKIDSTTEIFYSVSAPALKGYVSSRDFLDVRKIHLDSANHTYTGVFVSIDNVAYPPIPNKKIIRGINGPSLMRCSSGDVQGEALLEWVMKTDLKGALPRRLMQSSMLTYFRDHVGRLRAYIQQNRHSQSR